MAVPDPTGQPGVTEWWRDAVVYQIYIRSFADGDADGGGLRAGSIVGFDGQAQWAAMAGGRDAYRVDRDGWTLRSGDGSRAAHVEHTIAVTDDGPRVLTAP